MKDSQRSIRLRTLHVSFFARRTIATITHALPGYHCNITSVNIYILRSSNAFREPDRQETHYINVYIFMFNVYLRITETKSRIYL